MSAALLLLLTTTLASAAEVAASGVWTTKNYEIAGGWRIVIDGDGRFVELDEDFNTKKAPDLKLFLSPLPLADLTDRNATNSAVLIAPLESHHGEARYPIEPGVDLSVFQTVFIHCQRYSKLWGGAALEIE